MERFFGLPISIPIDTPFHQKFLLVSLFLDLDIKTTILSLVSLAILICCSHYIKSIPDPLLAMLFATFPSFFFNFTSIAAIGSVFGDIPRSLPKFEWLDMANINVIELIKPAFAIAFF